MTRGRGIGGLLSLSLFAFLSACQSESSGVPSSDVSIDGTRGLPQTPIGTSPSAFDLGDFLGWSDPGHLIGTSPSSLEGCNFPSDPVVQYLSERGVMECRQREPDALFGQEGSLFDGRVDDSDYDRMMLRFFGWNSQQFAELETCMGRDSCRNREAMIERFRDGLYACANYENAADALKPISSSKVRSYLAGLARGGSSVRVLRRSSDLSRASISRIFSFPEGATDKKSISISNASGNRIVVHMVGHPTRENLADFKFAFKVCDASGKRSIEESIVGIDESKIKYKILGEELEDVRAESVRWLIGISPEKLLKDFQTLEFVSPVSFDDDGRMFYASGRKDLRLRRSGVIYPDRSLTSGRDLTSSLPSRFRISDRRVNLSMLSDHRIQLNISNKMYVPNRVENLISSYLEGYENRSSSVSQLYFEKDAVQGLIRPWALLSLDNRYSTTNEQSSASIGGLDSFDLPLSYFSLESTAVGTAGKAFYWDDPTYSALGLSMQDLRSLGFEALDVTTNGVRDRILKDIRENVDEPILDECSQFEGAGFSGTAEGVERVELLVADFPQELFEMIPLASNICTQIPSVRLILQRHHRQLRILPGVFGETPQFIRAPDAF